LELREYQTNMIEKARELLRSGKKRIIIHAATGSGKTIIAAAIVSSALEKNKKVLFLVHYRELAYQALERFTEFGIGDEVSIIMAGEESHLDKPVQIASIQTYMRRLNLDELHYNPWFHKADLVIYDECHASIAKTRKAILELYRQDSVILGLTATPCRADGRGLGEVYEAIVPCSNIEELTTLGHLVPVIYYGCKEKPDLENIPIVAGDFNKKVLGERVDIPQLIGDIYDNWARIAIERQTVIFATNVKHSKHIKELFERRGIKIEHVDAHTPEDERRDILNRFKSGDVQVVTNCAVYSEGADFPWASCIVLAKPSKSYGRYVQMAGRGLRPYPEKLNCIILDHAGLVIGKYGHGFLDEEVYWTLDGKEKAWKKKAERKKEKKIFECEMCMTMHSGRRCPTCGWEIPGWGKKIETTDDELVELGKNKKPKASMQDKRESYAMLLQIQKSKGYSKGWLAHKYRALYDCWPKGMDGVQAKIPSDAIMNWIKYQNIKWAKSKANPKNQEKEQWTSTESNLNQEAVGQESITNSTLKSEPGSINPARTVPARTGSGSQIEMEMGIISATNVDMVTASI